ncbi:MAG TPA: folylpolyglutamate synthase/dihydrofolate synthase family protein [Acidimicrobiales bacterium]|nr:folylpolyglutamate synthase/dihydrofolate synthase family protein [Acidimicrobiales bacterium]
MNLGEALAWLDRHQNLERILGDKRLRAPHPDRVRHFAHLMGDPQRSQPVVHLTGTNGKTSTARALSRLLMAKGLTVGTFTSPHLERINERIMVDLEPISDVEFAEVLSDLAVLETLSPEGPRLNWFEVMAAAAFRYFSDKPVDVAVVEVGLGGRWDATNVADGTVSVVTNVGLDHVELLGPTRAHIAREKAGIVKPGSTLVLGEGDSELYEIFAAEQPDRLWWVGRDFAVEANEMAVGGRSLDLRTPGARYEGLYLRAHGRHQGDNFLDALVAAEAFFDHPIEEDLVAATAAELTTPGRLEVVQQRPLVLLDGAKNVGGAQASAAAVNEEFGTERPRVMVVGMLRGKDAREMLEALEVGKARLVVTCPPLSPRAQPAGMLAEVAASLGVRAVPTASVAEALDVALAEAAPEELVLVTGSLYTVGEARTAMRARTGEALGARGMP